MSTPYVKSIGERYIDIIGGIFLTAGAIGVCAGVYKFVYFLVVCWHGCAPS